MFKCAPTLLLSVLSPGRQSIDNSNSSSSQGFFGNLGTSNCSNTATPSSQGFFGNLGASNRSNTATPSVSWFNLPMDQFGHLTGGRNAHTSPTPTPPAAPCGANTAAVRDASQVSDHSGHIRHCDGVKCFRQVETERRITVHA